MRALQRRKSSTDRQAGGRTEAWRAGDATSPQTKAKGGLRVKRIVLAALVAALLLPPLAGCKKKQKELTPTERTAGDQRFREKTGGGPGAARKQPPPGEKPGS